MAKASKMNFDSGGKMAEEDAEEGGGKKFLLIIILIILLLAGGGAAAYFLLFSSDDSAETGEKPVQEQITEEVTAAGPIEASKLANPLYTPAKKYVVNLRDGRHFLTVQMVAALEDPDALAFLAKREPIIDDEIITLLGNLTSDDLRTPSGKALLKREIYKKMNGLFTQEFIDESEDHDATPVKKILFTEFILN